MDTSIFAKNLKNLRLELGLTQRQFADKINVSPSYISKLELNRIELNANIIIAIVREFNISSNRLLYGTE